VSVPFQDVELMTTGMKMTRLERPVEHWFWAAVALTLVVSLTPWAGFILYPFKLCTTWIHECGHALMTVLVGGEVTAITIEPDTSGLTRGLVPTTRTAHGLVASSGYLGTAVVGCLLLVATRVPRCTHLILMVLGVFMLLSVVFWMRNLFGFAVVLVWGAVLVLLSRRASAHVRQFLLSLLAVQVALNAVYDIRVLFQIDRGPSDAATMAQLFVLPSWVWALSWMVVSAGLLGATMWMTRGRPAYDRIDRT
jgi:hypothetical protein